MCIYLFVTLCRTSMACSNKYLVGIGGIMKQQRALLGVRTKAYDAQLEIHDDQNNVTQDKPTTQQFGFDNITAGRGWRYHIASTKQTCPGVIHACCSYPSSWEQQIWVKWNLFLWVCVCVVTTLLAEKKSFNCTTIRIRVDAASLRGSIPSEPSNAKNGCRGGAVRCVDVIVPMSFPISI